MLLLPSPTVVFKQEVQERASMSHADVVKRVLDLLCHEETGQGYIRPCVWQNNHDMYVQAKLKAHHARTRLDDLNAEAGHLRIAAIYRTYMGAFPCGICSKCKKKPTEEIKSDDTTYVSGYRVTHAVDSDSFKPKLVVIARNNGRVVKEIDPSGNKDKFAVHFVKAEYLGRIRNKVKVHTLSCSHYINKKPSRPHNRWVEVLPVGKDLIDPVGNIVLTIKHHSTALLCGSCNPHDSDWYE